MNSEGKRTAVVTGASSGIGAATAARLGEEGFEVVLGARRLERVQEIAARCRGRAVRLDVTDPRSVAELAGAVGAVHVLVNNAGVGLGLETVAQIDQDHVRAMWETNVLGLVNVTKALLPALEQSGDGHIVNVGSVSGFEVYPGGAGYTASKHAVRAITKTLRLELLGKPVRVSEINPGHVTSEFTSVRFGGDEERVAKTYEGFSPLSSEDVADCIAWVVTRPLNVNIDEVVMRSISQATATNIDRSG